MRARASEHRKAKFATPVPVFVFSRAASVVCLTPLGPDAAVQFLAVVAEARGDPRMALAPGGVAGGGGGGGAEEEKETK